MERVKYENRTTLSRANKEFILSKSHRKCCKCGCALTVDSPIFSQDHFIPLSKGGSNDIDNLVVLCKTCNKLKDNYVVKPRLFYRYLDEVYLLQLEELYEEYCKTISWHSLNQYTPEELIEFEYYQDTGKFNSFAPKSHSKNCVLRAATVQRAYLKKARPQDLQNICEYVRKYDKKYGWETDIEKISILVDDIYKRGCIYTLCKGDEIIAIFPITLSTDTVNGINTYMFALNGLPVLYQKEYYRELVYKCLRYIMDGFGAVNPKNRVIFEVVHPQNDSYLMSILNRGNESYTDDRANVQIDIYCYCLDINDRPKEISERDIIEYSNTLEDAFKMPSLR